MIEQVNENTKRYSLFNYGIVLAVTKNGNSSIVDPEGYRIVSLYSKWTPLELSISRPYATGRGESLSKHLPRSLKENGPMS